VNDGECRCAMSKRNAVSPMPIAQLENGDRPPPSPDILKKFARAYNVTIRELLLRAGYLDDPKITATEEERIEAAFQYVLSDPDYKLATRINGEALDAKSKKGVVITYETLTGKIILSV
jgi:transcriptional regulator with XRE-family HTH domain